jgi:DNA repair protein RecO (recombination protein O)
VATETRPPTPLHERIYRTEAIVLGRMEYQEADRILTIYTPGYGKLRVIAKGVRRPLSRLGPHLEYFARAQLMVARGRELDTVTGAETIDAHVGLRADLDAYGHASHLAEILNRLTQDRQENAAVYDLLARSLRLLADGVDPFAVTRHYELALLTLLGFKPELYRCVACETELTAAPNAFSSRLGGTLCPLCRTNDGASRQLSVNAQKYLRTLDRNGLMAVARLPIDESLRRELEGAMGDYLRHVAERDLASLRVWHALREGAPST